MPVRNGKLLLLLALGKEAGFAQFGLFFTKLGRIRRVLDET